MGEPPQLPEYVRFQDEDGGSVMGGRVFKATRARRPSWLNVRAGDEEHYFTCVVSGTVWRAVTGAVLPNTPPSIRLDAVAASASANYFEVLQLSPTVVVLKNLDNNLFCTHIGGALLAHSPTIDQAARLVVSEPVRGRLVHDVVFDENSATVSQVRQVLLGVGSVQNEMTHQADFVLDFFYSDCRSQQWMDSFTIKSGVPVTISSQVPTVSRDLQVIFTGESSSNSMPDMEDGVGSADLVTEQYTVRGLPPGEAVRITLQGTTATCTVPFTYSQTDTWFNGQLVTTHNLHGVFTGTNYSSTSWYAEPAPLQ